MELLFRETFDPGSTHDTCEQCLLAEHFLHHLRLFPEGQFVAVDTRTNQVVGEAVSMLTTFDPAHPHLEGWWASIGEGWLTPHKPQGDWLYGVESVVHPDYRGQGLGGRMMSRRQELVKRRNLRGILAGSMPRDFHLTPEDMSIDAYIQAVVEGKMFDTNLSKHLRMGFRPLHPIPDYVIDLESRRYGVLIVWDNPDYVASSS
jgi:GNAT superfamily N-acetyltransferase